MSKRNIQNNEEKLLEIVNDIARNNILRPDIEISLDNLPPQEFSKFIKKSKSQGTRFCQNIDTLLKSKISSTPKTNTDKRYFLEIRKELDNKRIRVWDLKKERCPASGDVLKLINSTRIMPEILTQEQNSIYKISFNNHKDILDELDDKFIDQMVFDTRKEDQKRILSLFYDKVAECFNKLVIIDPWLLHHKNIGGCISLINHLLELRKNSFFLKKELPQLILITNEPKLRYEKDGSVTSSEDVFNEILKHNTTKEFMRTLEQWKGSHFQEIKLYVTSGLEHDRWFIFDDSYVVKNGTGCIFFNSRSNPDKKTSTAFSLGRSPKNTVERYKKLMEYAVDILNV